MSKTIGIESIKDPLTQSELSKKSLCDYVVNVATGCLHGCKFCYVPSTPVIRMRQKELSDRGVEDPNLGWGDYLFIREDLPEALERSLSKKRTWKETPSGRGVVMLCSGTDPYQNQRVARVTREAVKTLLKYGKRVRILTRSPLWTQDLDILVHPNVTVGMSIPFLELDSLSRQIEPGSPLPSDRLKALEKGKKAGCRLYVAMAPTPPVLEWGDFVETLDQLTRKVDPEVIFWEPINARGSNAVRMAAAGIEWAHRVSSREAWAENFIEQWRGLEIAADKVGCGDRLHIWTDPGLKGFLSQKAIEAWWYKPTVENWN